MDVDENIAIIEDTTKNALGVNFFLPADVAKAFGAGYLDNDICRYWIVRQLHPETHPTCPSCRIEISDRALPRFLEGGRIYCNSCGKFFTALTGTVLSGCHLTFSGIFLLALFLGLGLRNDLIAEKLSLSSETVRLWQKKFQTLEQLRTLEKENGSAKNQ